MKPLQRIRNIKLAYLVLTIGWLPYGGIMGVLLGKYEQLMMAAFAIYAIAWIVMGVWESSVICPHCQQKFHSRPCRRFPAFNYLNCYSWKCLHCGIRVPLKNI